MSKSAHARTLMLLAAALVVAQCGFGGGTQFPVGSPTPTQAFLPEEFYALGQIRLTSAEEASRAISEAAAMGAASPNGEGWPDPEAYLVVMTLDGTIGTADPIIDRLVWLVHWKGLSGGPVPTGADEPLPYTRMYVFLDGETGDYLMTLYKV